MESLISVDSGSPEMQLDRAGPGQAELHHGAEQVVHLLLQLALCSRHTRFAFTS